MKSQLILQIHDELLLEVPEGEAEPARAMVKAIMEGALVLDVPAGGGRPPGRELGRGPLMGAHAILLLSCLDQKGLVATVSEWVYRHGGNIVGADQHSDVEQEVFLQRVEWELDGFGLARDEIAARFRPVAERFGMRWDLRFSDQVTRMAVLVSKLGHCLFDLLWRQKAAEFPAVVPLVVSNHPDLGPVAESFGARFECVPVTPEAREAAEGRLLSLLAEERIELIVLARYMQVVGPRVLDRLPAAHHQHPPFVPARVRGRALLPPGLRARGEGDRRHRALRDRGAGPGADHRAGRRARSPPRLGRGPAPEGARPREGGAGPGGGPARAPWRSRLRKQDGGFRLARCYPPRTSGGVP